MNRCSVIHWGDDSGHENIDWFEGLKRNVGGNCAIPALSRAGDLAVGRSAAYC